MTNPCSIYFCAKKATYRPMTRPSSEHCTPNQEQGLACPSPQSARAPRGSASTISLNLRSARPAKNSANKALNRVKSRSWKTNKPQPKEATEDTTRHLRDSEPRTAGSPSSGTRAGRTPPGLSSGNSPCPTQLRKNACDYQELLLQELAPEEARS